MIYKKPYIKFVLNIRQFNHYEFLRDINDYNLSKMIGRDCSWLSQVRSRYKRYENTKNPIIYLHLAQKIADILEVDISELGEIYDD